LNKHEKVEVSTFNKHFERNV